MIYYLQDKEIYFMFEEWDYKGEKPKRFLQELQTHGTPPKKEGSLYVLPSDYKDLFVMLKEDYFGKDKVDRFCSLK